MAVAGEQLERRDGNAIERAFKNLIGAQKRSGFVAALLTLTAFGRAKARRDSLRESLNLHLLT
jgi:hypothetical protein